MPSLAVRAALTSPAKAPWTTPGGGSAGGVSSSSERSAPGDGSWLEMGSEEWRLRALCGVLNPVTVPLVAPGSLR